MVVVLVVVVHEMIVFSLCWCCLGMAGLFSLCCCLGMAGLFSLSCSSLGVLISGRVGVTGCFFLMTIVLWRSSSSFGCVLVASL